MRTDDEKPAPRQISNHVVDPLPSGLEPRRTPMQGRVVRLEPPEPARHAADLYEATHGTAEALAIWDFIPYGPWPDQESFAHWLADAAARQDRVAFVICPTDTGRPCGMVQYHHIDAPSGTLELGGVWFAPELQRTRAATEALFLMLVHALDDLKYRRVQWRCDSHNERSRATARRLGFGFEGIFFHEAVIKGKNKDTAWYSMLDHEWPAAKAMMLAWLADDNFNAAGRAKTSLTAMMAQRGRARRALDG